RGRVARLAQRACAGGAAALPVPAPQSLPPGDPRDALGLPCRGGRLARDGPVRAPARMRRVDACACGGAKSPLPTMTTTAQRWGIRSHARARKSPGPDEDARGRGRASKRERRRPAREGGGAPVAKRGAFERGDWLAILLLAAACVLVYGNTIGNQFVWD